MEHALDEDQAQVASGPISSQPVVVASAAAPNPAALADAIERRLHSQRQLTLSDPTNYEDFDENHEKRQEFRRLIEPGILRRNPKHIATESLRVLLKLSENILAHPDDPKYHKFKPTNERIKTFLVDPKGTLEYAVALGFRPEVDNFQPFYIFNKKHMVDMEIGHEILKEIMEVEESKKIQEEKARREEKAAKQAEIDNLKLAFMDDRKSTALRVRREQAARQARESGPARSPPVIATPPSHIPGGGQTLRGDVVPESPPPYPRSTEADDDDDE